MSTVCGGEAVPCDLVVSRSSVSSSGIRLGFGVINLENTRDTGLVVFTGGRGGSGVIGLRKPGRCVFFLNVTSSREKDMVVVGRQVKSIDVGCR
eukprot:m.316184 g.316184  ORF g.316184 m.316184 type:complete len:94 (-) comp27540_c0_seq1:3353-3634(-)